MARSIEEMAAKGAAKLSAKGSIMASNWAAAKGKMQSSYEALPFGPNTKAAYRAGIGAATYRTPDVDKWRRNFIFGASR